jgi:hypothetical protein
MQYDVIIVGTDITGLITALHCIDAGYNALVLDDQMYPSQCSEWDSFDMLTDVRTSLLMQRLDIRLENDPIQNIRIAKVRQLVEHMQYAITPTHSMTLIEACKLFMDPGDYYLWLQCDPYLHTLLYTPVHHAIQILRDIALAKSKLFIPNMDIFVTALRTYIQTHSNVRCEVSQKIIYIGEREQKAHIRFLDSNGAVQEATAHTGVSRQHAAVPCWSPCQNTRPTYQDSTEFRDKMLATVHVAFPMTLPSQKPYEPLQNPWSMWHYLPPRAHPFHFEDLLRDVDRVIPHVFEDINYGRVTTKKTVPCTLSWADLDEFKSKHKNLQWVLMRDPEDQKVKVVDVSSMERDHIAQGAKMRGGIIAVIG